jgi:hypothetical protein
VRGAERLEHVGGVRGHARGEVPLLPRVVQEGPDVVDPHVLAAAQEVVGRQAVAQLVGLAIEGPAVHQRERARRLLERDPQIDEVDRRAEIAAIRRIVVKQPRGGAAEDLPQWGALDVLIRVDLAGGVVGRAEVAEAQAVGAGAAHEEAVGGDVEQAHAGAAGQRQRASDEAAADVADIVGVDATGGPHPRERGVQRRQSRQVGVGEPVLAEVGAEVGEGRAVEHAAGLRIVGPRVVHRGGVEGPRASQAAPRIVERDVLGPRERELGFDGGAAVRCGAHCEGARYHPRPRARRPDSGPTRVHGRCSAGLNGGVRQITGWFEVGLIGSSRGGHSRFDAHHPRTA